MLPIELEFRGRDALHALQQRGMLEIVSTFEMLGAQGEVKDGYVPYDHVMIRDGKGAPITSLIVCQQEERCVPGKFSWPKDKNFERVLVEFGLTREQFSKGFLKGHHGFDFCNYVGGWMFNGFEGVILKKWEWCPMQTPSSLGYKGTALFDRAHIEDLSLLLNQNNKLATAIPVDKDPLQWALLARMDRTFEGGTHGIIPKQFATTNNFTKKLWEIIGCTDTSRGCFLVPLFEDFSLFLNKEIWGAAHEKEMIREFKKFTIMVKCDGVVKGNWPVIRDYVVKYERAGKALMKQAEEALQKQEPTQALEKKNSAQALYVFTLCALFHFYLSLHCSPGKTEPIMVHKILLSLMHCTTALLAQNELVRALLLTQKALYLAVGLNKLVFDNESNSSFYSMDEHGSWIMMGIGALMGQVYYAAHQRTQARILVKWFYAEFNTLRSNLKEATVDYIEVYLESNIPTAEEFGFAFMNKLHDLLMSTQANDDVADLTVMFPDFENASLWLFLPFIADLRFDTSARLYAYSLQQWHRLLVEQGIKNWQQQKWEIASKLFTQAYAISTRLSMSSSRLVNILYLADCTLHMGSMTIAAYFYEQFIMLTAKDRFAELAGWEINFVLNYTDAIFVLQMQLFGEQAQELSCDSSLMNGDYQHLRANKSCASVHVQQNLSLLSELPAFEESLRLLFENGKIFKRLLEMLDAAIMSTNAMYGLENKQHQTWYGRKAALYLCRAEVREAFGKNKNNGETLLSLNKIYTDLAKSRSCKKYYDTLSDKAKHDVPDMPSMLNPAKFEIEEASYSEKWKGIMGKVTLAEKLQWFKDWKSLVEANKLLRCENEDACSAARGPKKSRSRKKKNPAAGNLDMDDEKTNKVRFCDLSLTFGAAGAKDPEKEVGALCTQDAAKEIWAAGAQDQAQEVGAAGAQDQAQEVGEAVVVDDEDKDSCCVCLDAPKQFVFGPCGHVCVCETCAKEVMQTAKECPMCRTPVVTAFKVFWK